MASDPLERPATTRRRFVIDALGGLAGAAWAGACGAREDIVNPARGAGGAGSLAGSRGAGGEADAGSPSTGGVRSDGAGGVSGGAGAGAGGAEGGVTGAGGAAGSATGGSGPDSGLCTLYPQETEGPFYLDLGLLRSDITEGRPGTPLELELQVVRASGCTPVKDAAVDVWHCDAAGVYAGFPGQLGGLDTTGQRSLRGTQVTGSDGRVVFKTIYPGWYPGRTTHVHFKVHLSATTEVTSQLYFPEETTATVYRTSPYDAHGPKDTPNATDATAHTGGMPPVVTVTGDGAGLVATLVITVLG